MSDAPASFSDRFPLPSPQRADRTRILIANIMLKKPNVRFEHSTDGSIMIRLPLDHPSLAAGELANARLVRTNWFADAVGGFLLHTNFEQLDEFVCSANYPALATQQIHIGFGLRISPRFLEFVCQAELLNRIFNERLRWDLRGVRA